MRILLQTLVLNLKIVVQTSKESQSKHRFAKVKSSQTDGLSGEMIEVEADITLGLYSFSIIGLPDKAVDESRDRVASAIKHIGIKPPRRQNQKIVISLAPADKKKEGSIFDLPIALAYLKASGNINSDLDNKIFIGELGLDGTLRGVKGVIPILEHAKKSGIKEIYIPEENRQEANIIEGIDIYPVKDLGCVVDHLNSAAKLIKIDPATVKKTPFVYSNEMLFEDIKGQDLAKRALIIAAAGNHNIMLYGPPGTGKTLLAKALRSLLPPLTQEEMLVSTAIYSVNGTLEDGKPITVPPFRSPHHTSSYVSIVGGGAHKIKPGEISLAHNGVLFLDEFPEFDKRVIESLREPLEEHKVTIARASGTLTFPSMCILVTALNPCPCGKRGSEEECTCLPSTISNYQRKITGPIMDRIDMWIYIDKVDYKVLDEINNTDGISTKNARECVLRAREIQRERFKGTPITKNSEMTTRYIDQHIQLDEGVREIFHSAAKKLSMSPRGYHRTLKCAQTIADLEGNKKIQEQNILEAIQYRENRLK